MKHLRRIIATLVVGLFAMVALPGTAHAHTEPVRPDSGAVPLTGPLTAPHPYQATASHVSSSGWGLALTIGLTAVVVVAIAVAVAGRRVARHRRGAGSPALGV